MSCMLLLLNIVYGHRSNCWACCNALLRTSVLRRCLPITSVGYGCPRRSRHTVLIGCIIERPPRCWPIAMTRARVGLLMRGNGAWAGLLVGSPRLSCCPRPTGSRGRWLLWWGAAVRGSVRLWDARVVVPLNLLSRGCGLLVVVRIVVDLLLLTVVVRRRRC